MSWEEPTDDELTDAMIEDTVHCQVCRASMLCGSNDCFIVSMPYTYEPMNGPPQPRCHQITLCGECIKGIHDEYRRACAEMGEEP